MLCNKPENNVFFSSAQSLDFCVTAWICVHVVQVVEAALPVTAFLTAEVSNEFLLTVALFRLAQLVTSD